MSRNAAAPLRFVRFRSRLAASRRASASASLHGVWVWWHV